jgi:MoxR-like ATPase
MEEQQVSVEGETRPLPNPFFVIATQNPTHQIGTFPLPESQLDRFLLRIELGYPDAAAERELLIGKDRRDMLQSLRAQIGAEELQQLQLAVQDVFVSGPLLDYVQSILEYSRQTSDYVSGLSPRAGLALLHGARAWALMSGRNHVLPEDVQVILPHVVNHRLRLSNEQDARRNADAATSLLQLPIP